MDQRAVRQKAETILQEQAELEQALITQLLNGQDPRTVLHELRVHQIELEMQNDELRRMQDSLLQARKEYFELYNMAPVAYLTLDCNGIIKNINLRGADMLARSQRYLINRPLLPHIHAHYHSHFVGYLDAVLVSNSRMQTELFLATHDRSVTIDAVAAETEKNERLCRMVMTDITHLRQVERSLRVEKEQWAITFNSIADGVIVTDTKGQIDLINPPAVTMLRRTKESIQGKSLLTGFPLLQNDSQQPLAPLLLRLIGEPALVIPTTALLPVDNQQPLLVELSASLIRDGNSVLGIIIVFRDATEKQQRQAEEVRIQKLEALGTLAGGIAHDFNNLLAGFFGKVELARRHLTPDHRSYQTLEAALRSLERATGLTKQLLTFAKGGAPIKEVLMLADVLTESAQFALHGSNVKLQLAIAPDLWPVAADRGQIGQVISNLVINAQQAMPDGGTVHLVARNVEQFGQAYVQITVKDEGSGIAPHHLPRIFDPYFTTKSTGSGLGLTASHSIIQRHNGTLEVESKLHHGTCVTIALPASPFAQQPAPQPPFDEHLLTALAPATILVVDDDSLLRGTLGEALTELGHKVTFAVDGQSAVDLYQQALQANAPYDLVITDLTIPGAMGGKEAAQAILAIDPHAKLIVSSGYATDAVIANYADYGFMARLVKPYRIRELQSALYRVLMPPLAAPSDASAA